MTEKSLQPPETRPRETTLAEPAVTKFDFLEFQRLGTSRLEQVRERYENVAKDLSMTFSSILGVAVEMQIGGVTDAVALSEASATDAAGYVAMLESDEENWAGLWWLGQDSVAMVLDLLLGGTGLEPPSVDRPLTAVEEPLLRNLFERVTDELVSNNEAAEIKVGKLREIVRTHGMPEALRYTPSVAVEMQLLRQQATHSLRLVFPVPAATGRSESSGKERSSEEERRKKLQLIERLEPTSLQAEVIVSGLIVTVSDLLALRSGDVLVFQRPHTLPAELVLNGIPCFAGQLVAKNGMKTLSIQQAVDLAPSCGEA